MTKWLNRDDSYLVEAAIRYNDQIYTGIRHSEIFQAMKDQGLPRLDVVKHHVQGFVTADGHFVDRSEGYSIAQRYNQLPNGLFGQVLTSEDLWDNEGQFYAEPLGTNEEDSGTGDGPVLPERAGH